ncbi:MAG: PilZ domain-containing protein [Candidatus Omnitrophota bacterium]
MRAISIIFLSGFILSNLALAQDLTEKSIKSSLTEEVKGEIFSVNDGTSLNGTRILISTSGLAQFDSYLLDEPPRLVIAFQSKNVVSKIGNEVVVNQGVIKRITSSYFEGGEKRLFKSLIFELTQKAPYEIRQENDSILIDIQAPFKGTAFSIDGNGFVAASESSNEKLKAMDLAFIQAAEKQIVLETSEVNPVRELRSLTVCAEGGLIPPSASSGDDYRLKSVAFSNGVKAIKESPEPFPFVLLRVKDKLREGYIVLSRFFPPLLRFAKQRGGGQNDGFLGLLQRPQFTINAIFQILGLVLASGVGFLLFWRRYRLILDKNMAIQEIAGLKSELERKNKLLEQEEIIRKTIEAASLAKEKEFEQLKLKLQQEAELLEQAEESRKTMEDKLSQKEKECNQLKNSFESLREILVKNGLAKKLSSSVDEEEFWIAGKSQERRQLPRLDLNRDYSRTIVLRIESQDKSKSVKSFASNVSSGGLCFETRNDFKKSEIINLRVFFFGDRVPIMKIRAEVIWKKAALAVNNFGASFVSLEERDKIELERYLESNLIKPAQGRVVCRRSLLIKRLQDENPQFRE